MNKYSQVLERMREGGLRLTPQRVMIISAIEAAKGHTTAEEIYERVRQEYPYIDMTTVYRTLQLLTKLHMVLEVSSGGISSYEIAEPARRHHHMVCEECGATFDLSPKYLDALREQLVREVGFEPHMEHFTLSGLCHDCHSKKRGVA